MPDCSASKREVRIGQNGDYADAVHAVDMGCNLSMSAIYPEFEVRVLAIPAARSNPNSRP